MSCDNFDILIIGSGPGGYVAAIRASQLGFKVGLIEANHLGGICLNWGCIPTKALLRSAEVYHTMMNAKDYGFSVKDVKINFENIIQRSRNIAQKLSSGVEHLMKKNKITVINGYGYFNGKITEKNNLKHIIKVKQADENTIEVSAKHVIIATGARARNISGLETDQQLIWSYKEAMKPDIFPNSLLVVGSGAIGVEFSSFYAALGCKVTLVEALDRILPVEDVEISKIAETEFTKQGINVLTSAKLQKFDKKSKKVDSFIEINGKIQKITTDRVIMAVGIVGNVENLALETTNVVVENSWIQTDDYGRTAEENIYAIGDIAGAPWLAHKASHEGVLCVETIAGLKTHKLNKDNIPGCAYCRPQIASVGLTEEKAKAQGYELKIGRFPYLANGKAIALNEENGLIKVIFDAKNGELLGVHMIGAEVTEMIGTFLLGKTMEAVETDFIETIFPHPTLSEMMHESVLAAFNKALHV